MRWWLALTALASGLATAAWFAIAPPRIAKESKPQQAAPEAAVRESQLDRMERAIGGLERRLVQLELGERLRRTEPTASSAAGPGEHVDRSPVDVDEEMRVRAERQTQALVNLSQTEPRDPTWAPAYETQLRDSIRSTPGAGEVSALSCRASICRFEVKHAAAKEQATFMQEFQGTVPEHAAYRMTPHESDDGTASTEVYLIRQGYPIPGHPIVHASRTPGG
jgi:hypothetical protein